MTISDVDGCALSSADLEHFIHHGFVRLDGAFPRTTADAARAILWRDTECDPDDPATWTRPVVRLGMYSDKPFIEAANTARLHRAFDQLVGEGRWLPCGALGTFPVRFPSPEDTGDTGWHVDVSFGWDDPDFMNWRANVSSKGRAMLMLFLFSDVGPDDAPTRLLPGSHRHIARGLEKAGDEGLTLREIVDVIEGLEPRPEALATGPAGTVYLCHPFLVHAAQPHLGQTPRFMAQPPLLPRTEQQLNRSDGAYSVVERATRSALGLSD